MTTPRTILVLGGARSGKSRHAQALAEAMTPTGCFIATAQAWDEEMRDRIFYPLVSGRAGGSGLGFGSLLSEMKLGIIEDTKPMIHHHV